MATDITTRSALHRAKAKATIATTLTLSEVMNSKKLGPRTSPSSPPIDWASFEETLTLRVGVLIGPCKSLIVEELLVNENVFKCFVCDDSVRVERSLLFENVLVRKFLGFGKTRGERGRIDRSREVGKFIVGE